MATVYIAHASLDERGAAHGGAAGDQTGKEVCRRAWYNANWDLLLRPRSKVVAARMVHFVLAVCAGNMVGYDQWQRNTLRDVARAAGWDGSRISTKCETDCSAFMAVAAEAAGVNMDKAYTPLGNGTYNAPVTSTMLKTFTETGAFIALQDSIYLTRTDYLEAGDILVRQSGHTAMVVTNGAKAINPTELDGTERSATVYTEPKLYEVTTKTDPLNVRHEPGSAGAIIGQFARSEVVTVDSEAVLEDGSTWLHATNGALTGWASAAYMTAVTETAPEKKEVNMDIATFLESLTPEQAACIVDLAQNYRAKLPESEWATGELDEAVEFSITDGMRPRAFATREEVAVMVKRAFERFMGAV